MVEQLNTDSSKIDYSWNDDNREEIKGYLDFYINQTENILSSDNITLKDVYGNRVDLLNLSDMYFNHNLYLDDSISKQNKSLNYISNQVEKLDKILETNNSVNSLSKQFDTLSKNDENIILKLSEIEKKSDNEVIKEEFKQLSDDIVTTINNNNINNISLLVGVIIGISIINVFFHQYSNKL